MPKKLKVDGSVKTCKCPVAQTVKCLPTTWEKVKVKSLSCVQLCDPVDCSLPSSSVHGILQARILEWVAILLQGIFPIQGSNPGFLHWRQTL